MVRLTGQIFGTGYKPPKPVKDRSWPVEPVKSYHYDIGRFQGCEMNV